MWLRCQLKQDGTRTIQKKRYDPRLLHGVHLGLRSKAKFLGAILDKKLKWRENIIQSYDKATAFADGSISQ